MIMDGIPRVSVPDLTRITSPSRLAAALRATKILAGDPSLREIEERAARHSRRLSRSTVSRMLAGQVIPSEESMLAFLTACGVPPEAQHRWVEARTRLVLAAAGSSSDLLEEYVVPSAALMRHLSQPVWLRQDVAVIVDELVRGLMTLLEELADEESADR
jgi:hypothetical protein